MNYIKNMLNSKLNRAQIEVDNLIREESELFIALKEVKEKRIKRADERNQLIKTLKVVGELSNG